MYMHTSRAPRGRQVRRLAIVIGLGAMLALSACGSSGSTSDAGTSGTGSSSAATAAKTQLDKLSQPVAGSPDLGSPVKSSDLAGKTIFYIPFTLQAIHFSLVQHSLEEALTTVGATVRTCDGQANPTQFSACMDQAVQQKPAAVITDYIPYELAPTAYQKLRSAGIPVFVADAEPAQGVTTSATFAFGNPDSFGFKASEAEDDAVIADSDAKAHVLYLQLNASAAITAQGQHGVDYFKSACPDCVVTVKQVNLGMNNIPSLVSSALISDSSINYVVPQTDTYLSAALSGIQAAGKTNSIKVASVADALASLQQVKSNPHVIAMAGSNPTYVAWTMADSVIRMLAGQMPPKDYPVLNRVFTKQNIGSLDLSTAGEASGEWFGSTAYKQAFEKLWGVK